MTETEIFQLIYIYIYIYIYEINLKRKINKINYKVEK